MYPQESALCMRHRYASILRTVAVFNYIPCKTTLIAGIKVHIHVRDVNHAAPYMHLNITCIIYQLSPYGEEFKHMQAESDRHWMSLVVKHNVYPPRKLLETVITNDTKTSRI